MYAKTKLLDTFIKTILRFFAPFSPRLASKFSKSANMTHNFFLQKSFGLSKDAEIQAEFKSVIKFQKTCYTKL